MYSVSRLNLPYSESEVWTAKVFDPTSGLLSNVTLRPDGTVPDRATIHANETAAQGARFGRLSARLFNRLANLSDTNTVDVQVWTTAPASNVPREQMLSAATAPSIQAATSTALTTAAAPITSWFRTKGITSYADNTQAPFVKAHLTKAQINQLASLKAVAGIDLAGKPVMLSVPPPSPTCSPTWHATTAWYDTINMAGARDLSPSKGSSLFVGMLDGGAPTRPEWLRMYSERFPNQPYDHSEAVAGILGNTYTGTVTSTTNSQVISSACNDAADRLACDGAFEYFWTGNGGLPAPWAVSAINVSMSFVDVGDTNPADYPWSTVTIEPSDRYIDFLTKQAPFPLFVMAAGNSRTFVPQPYVVNKAYNALIVGASNDNGTSDPYDDTIGWFSSYMNPPLNYGDYELPQLVAPGVGIASADMIALPDTPDPQHNYCPANLDGTSFSAPQVTGTAILVAAADQSTYYGWPEMIKTTIMATTTYNVDGAKFTNLLPGSTHGGITDRADGLGMLNAAAAVNLANNSNWAPPGSVAKSKGRWAHSLNMTTDFDNPDLQAASFSRYYWNVTAQTTGRMKIVIVWDSTSYGCTYYSGGILANGAYPFLDYCAMGDFIDANLALAVYDNNTSLVTPICVSTTLDSNWEACDVPVTAGQNLTVKILRSAVNAPTTGFSIAWNNYTDPMSNIPKRVPIPRAASTMLAGLLLLIGILAIRRKRMGEAVGIVGILLSVILTACGSSSLNNTEDALGTLDVRVSPSDLMVASPPTDASTDQPPELRVDALSDLRLVEEVDAVKVDTLGTDASISSVSIVDAEIVASPLDSQAVDSQGMDQEIAWCDKPGSRLLPEWIMYCHE